jgi:hypothetical protein
MLGASGPKGSGSYGFHRYDDVDELSQTKPSQEQIDAGDSVDGGLGLCSG